MAEPDFPISIDRRRSLASAAAISAACTGPGVNLADAAAPNFVQASTPTPKAAPPNFSAATSRRLAAIKRRNEIRREADLPLLSIAKELRQMKEREVSEEFSGFEAAHGKAIFPAVWPYPRLMANSFAGLARQRTVPTDF